MKINNLLIVLTIIFFLAACSADNEELSLKFQLKNANNIVTWTAYKTTDKTAVEGSFKTVNITSNSEGNTIKETIEDAKFSIPVADLLASGKEYNIIQFFFGVMADPNTITGQFKITNDTNGYIILTMGGVTENLDFTYVINDNNLEIEAIMDLDDWQVEESLTALNNACKFLHAGSDGIVKVWNTVDIKASIDF